MAINTLLILSICGDSNLSDKAKDPYHQEHSKPTELGGDNELSSRSEHAA